MQKNEIRTSLTPYTKINSKWSKDLDIRLEIIKLLEGNKNVILHNLQQYLIIVTSQSNENKKLNKWDHIEIKSFCTVKENKQNKKTTHRMGENTCK